MRLTSNQQFVLALLLIAVSLALCWQKHYEAGLGVLALLFPSPFLNHHPASASEENMPSKPPEKELP